MKRVVIGGALTAAVLAAVAPASASAAPSAPAGTAAAAVPLGGYDMSAVAAPMSLLVYTNGIPLPPPQGELHVSYTRTQMETGPSNRALSSTVWPGDALGTEWGLLTQTGKPYPVQANAAYPGGQAKQDQTQFPGVNEDVTAAQDTATATATMGEFPASAPSQVAQIGHLTSHSAVTYAGSTVTATATSSAHDISLLGGVIHIEAVSSAVSAASDGHHGLSSVTQRVVGLTVAGQPFTVDQKGVHPGSGPSVPLPGVPAQGEALLQQFGLQLFGPGAVKSAQAAAVSVGSHALEISVDTAPFYNALNKLPLSTLLQLVPNQCVPLPSQIPLGSICTRDELFYALSLAPRIVFVFGDVTASANGAPGFPAFVPTLPTLPTSVGATHVSGGAVPTAAVPAGSSLGGSSAPSTGQSPQIATEPAALATPGFSGVPAGLVLLGLAVAAAVGYLLYRYGWGLLPGVAGVGGCELGAASGVPDLRRGGA